MSKPAHETSLTELQGEFEALNQTFKALGLRLAGLRADNRRERQIVENFGEAWRLFETCFLMVSASGVEAGPQEYYDITNEQEPEENDFQDTLTEKAHGPSKRKSRTQKTKAD
ncbi:hypothetical protein GO003_002770 [Methylicorpusculum oleiharenae]|uniref:hypothetical protein n=1 Tax=Methylicorpusculum oleiharenae TaxID=1338687 RepID=UPI0013594341|nr:hypothetical protein [Methylicorpusculum oleiharenae]MCD2449311.1 hypothetical protein [Methylicorpusculum oleiharenae]